MGVIHISESEASRDFASLLARVRAGEEVVIGSEDDPIAIMRRPDEPRVRRLSESLRLLRERGSQVTLDGGFEGDLNAATGAHQEPLNPPAWD